MIGIAQGIFFSAVLMLSRRGSANRYLGVAVLSVALGLLDTVLVETRLVLFVPHLSVLLSCVDATYGPLMYVYVRSLTDASFVWRRKLAWHLAPAGALLLLYVPILLMPPDFLRAALTSYLEGNGQDDPDLFSTILDVGLIGQAITYLAVCLRHLTRFEHQLKESYSELKKRSVGWLRLCLLSLLLLWLLWAILTFVDSRGMTMLLPLTGSIVIQVLSFVALRRADVFRDIPERPRYENSVVDGRVAATVQERLWASMNENRLYQNPDLTIQDLAEAASHPARVVSQVLNDQMNLTFFDFVNSCRIERAKELLRESDDKILAIAYDVGFNSKSAFNAAFRKYTGTTPSFFRSLNQKKTLRPMTKGHSVVGS